MQCVVSCESVGATERGRSHQAEMGCSGRRGAPRASCRGARRASRAPRSHRPSSWDNTGSSVEGAARATPDIRERVVREACARGNLHRRRRARWRRRIGWRRGWHGQSSRDALDLCTDAQHEGLQLGERQCICRRPRVQHEVDGRCVGEQHRARQLAKPALEPVAIDRRPTMSGNDQSDARMGETRKGSDHANIEMFGP